METIPKGFTPKKQKKEIKKILEKTLVDKILVEDIAKELKTVLENEKIAEMLTIGFEKSIDLSKNKNLETVTERIEYPVEYLRTGPYPKEIRDRISIADIQDLQRQEINKILNLLREEGIKEEEIIKEKYDCLDIISKDFMYKLVLNAYSFENIIATGKTVPFTKTTKEEEVQNSPLKRILGQFQKISQEKIYGVEDTKVQKEIIGLPLVNVYTNPKIKGTINYLKFNHEHNIELVKIIQKAGYEISLSF